MMTSKYPRVLTIAGSDSSGGAGIEADLKVITAHKCYGMTAITALTAQNTTGVRDIHNIPAEFLRTAISAVIEDVGVDVVKMGMLANKQSIRVVANAMERYSIKNIVLDPVMVATSGSILLPADAIEELCDRLIPLATIITPNIPEAQQLLACYLDSRPLDSLPTDDIKSMADVVSLAKKLQERTSTAVLVKGGHLPFAADGSVARRPKDKVKILDVLILNSGDVKIFNSSYIDSKNTHGTGCTLASAIACNLAKSNDLISSVLLARNYVFGAIAASLTLGHGNGPVNHVHNLYQLPFSKGYFLDYLTSHPRIAPIWKQYINHNFTLQIANGTVSLEKFKWFLQQDYLFLIHFARANALAAYKSTTLPSIAHSANKIIGIKQETELHKTYCSTFGLSEADLLNTPEAPSTTAYTRYVLDIGISQDYDALQVALAACIFGYGEIGEARRSDVSGVTTKEGNKFWGWVETYVSEDYTKAVNEQRGTLEDAAITFSVQKVEQSVEIFRRVAEMERDFFTAALELEV